MIHHSPWPMAIIEALKAILLSPKNMGRGGGESAVFVCWVSYTDAPFQLPSSQPAIYGFGALATELGFCMPLCPPGLARADTMESLDTAFQSLGINLQPVHKEPMATDRTS